MALKSNEIFCALKLTGVTKDLFQGVFASDKLPTCVAFPAAIVINTDPHDMPGEHWIAVFAKSHTKAEYFDSFGLPPYVDNITRWLSKMFDTFIFSDKIVQSEKSNSCGYH